MVEIRAPRATPRALSRDKENPTKEELEGAYDEIRTLVKLHEDPTAKGDLERHPVLPGVTRRSGDRINAIVAMRIQGYRDQDISKLLDIPQPEPHRLERLHPDAFARAEVVALANWQRKYEVNLVRTGFLLTECAPKMVQVLAELAENPEVKENVRRQCAVDILNLAGIGYSRQSYGGKDRDVSAGAKTYIQNIITSDSKPLTLDAIVDTDVEEAEVIQEPVQEESS